MTTVCPFLGYTTASPPSDNDENVGKLKRVETTGTHKPAHTEDERFGPNFGHSFCIIMV